MTKDDDEKLLIDIVKRRGEDFVLKSLNARDGDRRELTIVSNAGLHPIPYDYVRGEIFIASEGNLDFSDIESVNSELDKIAQNLKTLLFSEKWTHVYLLPFGHSSISLTIKMTVFRLLRIETIDIFYFGSGKYDYLERDSRSAILRIT